MDPKIAYVQLLVIAYLYYFTYKSPVIRHDFGAPLTHKVMYNLNSFTC